jgi:hypothetical protein
MKTLKLSFLLLLTVLLASCGSHMSGTYVNSGGLGGKITFVSGSKAQIEMMGATTECTYEKEGNQVKLINGDKNQILTIDKNGCLDGGEMMGKYCKQ